MVRREKTTVVCLIETKLSSIKLEKIKWKLEFSHGFGVGVDGRRGGLGLL